MDQQAVVPGASLENDATQPQPAANDASYGANPLTDDQLRDRYVIAIRALSDEAASLGKIRLLMDAMAWEVSVVIDGFGQIAAGDFLKSLGTMLFHRSEVRRAQGEAEEAAADGRKPS